MENNVNIVLGAGGQIGSSIVNELLEKGQKVRAVLRNFAKADELRRKGTEVFIADYFDKGALEEAFKGGDCVFLLTPEDFSSKDVIADAKTIVGNYRDAIFSSGINKIVGLSTNGAQCRENSGNLEMSYILEHAFTDIDVVQTFIRPAYYYSNWLAYMEVVKEYGVLPTFFPVDMKIQMIAPRDVSVFIAKVMSGEVDYRRIYELTGPAYSSIEIAGIFSKILSREVIAQQIPQHEWEESLMKAGFSADASKNMILMTLCVIEGRTVPEYKPVQMTTTFEEFLKGFC